MSTVSSVWGYMRRNPSLLVGLLLLLSLVLFSGIGHLAWDTSKARAISVPGMLPPSAKYPLGTDRLGRDVLAVMIAGTPLTLRIGVFAGLLGVAVATVLAFVAAYYGGAVDVIIRGVVDVGLTIPSLMILIVVAMTLRAGINVNQMTLVVASTAWLWPTRTMRSQVLSMKERSYVEVARLSGMSGLEIIVKELMPNLMPFIVANLVNTIASAILAAIGLEALGLGALDTPSLGVTLYWVIYYSAVLNGWYWWWIPPIAIIVIVFVGLFLASTGMDEIANPRLRKAA